MRFGIAELPRGITMAQLHAVSWLGGIGFTVSIFIAGLTFPEREQYAVSRIAVLMASIFAAISGGALLAYCLNSRRNSLSRVKARTPCAAPSSRFRLLSAVGIHFFCMPVRTRSLGAVSPVQLTRQNDQFWGFFSPPLPGLLACTSSGVETASRVIFCRSVSIRRDR